MGLALPHPLVARRIQRKNKGVLPLTSARHRTTPLPPSAPAAGRRARRGRGTSSNAAQANPRALPADSARSASAGTRAGRRPRRSCREDAPASVSRRGLRRHHPRSRRRRHAAALHRMDIERPQHVRNARGIHNQAPRYRAQLELWVFPLHGFSVAEDGLHFQAAPVAVRLAHGQYGSRTASLCAAKLDRPRLLAQPPSWLLRQRRESWDTPMG